MVVKAINDIIGPNKLVLTLLIIIVRINLTDHL